MSLISDALKRHEGCNINGWLEVERVAGNIHFAVGWLYKGLAGWRAGPTLLMCAVLSLVRSKGQGRAEGRVPAGCARRPCPF